MISFMDDYDHKRECFEIARKHLQKMLKYLEPTESNPLNDYFKLCEIKESLKKIDINDEIDCIDECIGGFIALIGFNVANKLILLKPGSEVYDDKNANKFNGTATKLPDELSKSIKKFLDELSKNINTDKISEISKIIRELANDIEESGTNQKSASGEQDDEQRELSDSLSDIEESGTNQKSASGEQDDEQRELSDSLSKLSGMLNFSASFFDTFSNKKMSYEYYLGQMKVFRNKYTSYLEIKKDLNPQIEFIKNIINVIICDFNNYEEEGFLGDIFLMKEKYNKLFLIFTQTDKSIKEDILNIKELQHIREKADEVPMIYANRFTGRRAEQQSNPPIYYPQSSSPPLDRQDKEQRKSSPPLDGQDYKLREVLSSSDRQDQNDNNDEKQSEVVEPNHQNIDSIDLKTQSHQEEIKVKKTSTFANIFDLISRMYHYIFNLIPSTFNNIFHNIFSKANFF